MDEFVLEHHLGVFLHEVQEKILSPDEQLYQLHKIVEECEKHYVKKREFDNPDLASFNKLETEFEVFKSRKIDGVSFGLPSLDNCFYARGMTVGNVYIVSGRPGDGKTCFANHCLRQLFNAGFKVGVFSVDTPFFLQAASFLSTFTAINSSAFTNSNYNNGGTIPALRDGRKIAMPVKQAFEENHAMFTQLSIGYFNGDNTAFPFFRAWEKLEINELMDNLNNLYDYGYRAFILDYIQQLYDKHAPKNTGAKEMLDICLTKLKHFFKTKECIGILLSQVNRGSRNENVSNGTLAGTDQIAWVADCVMVIENAVLTKDEIKEFLDSNLPVDKKNTGASKELRKRISEELELKDFGKKIIVTKNRRGQKNKMVPVRIIYETYTNEEGYEEIDINEFLGEDL